MDRLRARGFGRHTKCAGRSRVAMGEFDARGAATDGSERGEEMTGSLALLIVVSPLVGADVPKTNPADPAASAAKLAEDLEKLREQIARDMQAVEKKLTEQDPGDSTRNLQK